MHQCAPRSISPATSEAKVIASRGNRSLSAVVNDALRAFLARQHGAETRTDWADDKEAIADLLGDNALP